MDKHYPLNNDKPDQNTIDQLQVENADLHANIDHAVHICYKLIKAFHPLIGLQTKSIVDICKLTADSKFFRNEEYYLLETSAWLQNIGLISISREILTRYIDSPKELSADELKMIKNHPVFAEKMLASFTGKLKRVGSIVKASRERWNGTGFPLGIAGELIPIPARFLAIAIYYTESHHNKEETIEEITQLSGEAFHPESVRLFMKVMEQSKLPPKVKELLLGELKPGMMLAHPIYTPTGVLLFPQDKSIEADSLNKLLKYDSLDPIKDRILVYR